MKCKLYSTNTGQRDQIYYVQQIPDRCEQCDLFINRSGELVDIKTQEVFPRIPKIDELKVLLVGGKTSGVEMFEQAFTIQQIETLRYISASGYEFELFIKGINPDIKHLFK